MTIAFRYSIIWLEKNKLMRWNPLKLNPYLKKVGFITLLGVSVLSLARSHPVHAESEPSEETGVKRTIKIVVDESFSRCIRFI